MYNIVVQIDVNGAEKIDKTTDSLDDASQAATRTTTALGQMGTAGAAAAEQMAQGGGKARTAMDDLADAVRGASTATTQLGSSSSAAAEFTLREMEILQRIGAPAREWAAELQALNHLHELGAIAMSDYEAQLVRAREAYGETDRAESLLAESLQREARLLEQVRAPLREYEQDMITLAELQKRGELQADQYEAALARVQRRGEQAGAIGAVQGPAFKPELAGLAEGPIAGPAFDPNQAGRGISEELRREQQVLEAINAPLREYEAQLRTLSALLEKGEIDLAQYDAQLAKAQKRAEQGGAIAPVQGPKQQTATAAGGGEGGGLSDALHAVAPQFGQGGMMLSQFASGGAMAAAGTAALVLELGHLSDEYTTLANKVERFSTSTQSADDILRQQLDLSKQLHADLAATEELYVRVRESTHELNLSQQQQLQLAHDLGVEVAAEGHSVEEASTLVRRLGLAFETGAISGRELRSIFKQFPEIGSELSEALGHTQAQLLQMANKGQISAQQLVDAFHKMEPEAEASLKRLDGTFSQKAGHLWDLVKVNVGGAIKDYFDAYKSPAEIAQQSFARQQHEQAEAARQLRQEMERNARTADIAGAAQSVGIDIGPFNKELADKITETRMTARQAGVDIADAFEGAKAKAQLYGAKIDEIREQHAAKEIADDAKRIYEALYGADDVIKAQVKQWTDIADKAKIAAQAAEKFRTTPPPNIPAPQRDQMQRELDLAATNARSAEANAQYGQSMVTYSQGVSTARAEMEALNRAAKDGVISGEALRQKQDALLTTLNDGRLPEAVKIMEGLTLPVQQAARDFAALNALFRQSRVDVVDYTAELDKIAKVGHGNDATILSDGIARLHQVFDEGLLTLRTYDEAVQKLVKDYSTLHTTASGIQYRIAPQGPEGPAGLLPKTGGPIEQPGITGGADLRGIMAEVQSGPQLVPGESDEAKRFNEQLERANQLANEFVAPSVKYEQRLKDISVALGLNSITEDQATAARRRARDTLNQENEALEAQKGPMEAYQAALRKLNDQLQAHDISQRQYAQGLDKAKEAMLQATGQAQTFSGAMQIDWIKMKQDADGFGASVANLAIADFGKLNDAIVTAANGGAVSWSQMADSMIQDLERVFLKAEETQLIGWLVSLSGSGGGAASGAAGLTGLPTNVDQLSAPGDDLWGFANGGSFMVGGSGPPDSKLFNMALTPGEMVTVQTSAQQQTARTAQGAAQQPAPVIHVHNHYDKSLAIGAIASAEGQAAVMNVLRANAPGIRAALGIRGS